MRTETRMGALTEPEMAVGCPIQHQLVWPVECVRIAVGGGDNQENFLAPADFGVANDGIGRARSAVDLDGTGVAYQLVVGGGVDFEPCGVIEQSMPEKGRDRAVQHAAGRKRTR